MDADQTIVYMYADLFDHRTGNTKLICYMRSNFSHHSSGFQGFQKGNGRWGRGKSLWWPSGYMCVPRYMNLWQHSSASDGRR